MMLRTLIFLVSLGARLIRAIFRRRADLDTGRASRARATRDGLASLERFADSSRRWHKTAGGSRRTSYRSPWQNGTAEHWIGSYRREMHEHVVVLSESRHLVRLASALIDSYHEDRCHLGLDKDSPNERPVESRPSPTAEVVALPRVGGLHHRYEWREAA